MRATIAPLQLTVQPVSPHVVLVLVVVSLLVVVLVMFVVPTDRRR